MNNYFDATKCCFFTMKDTIFIIQNVRIKSWIDPHEDIDSQIYELVDRIISNDVLSRFKPKTAISVMGDISAEPNYSLLFYKHLRNAIPLSNKIYVSLGNLEIGRFSSPQEANDAYQKMLTGMKIIFIDSPPEIYPL